MLLCGEKWNLRNFALKDSKGINLKTMVHDRSLGTAICNITNIMRYIYFHEVVSDMVLFLNCRPAMKAAHRFDSRGGDDLDLMESSEYVDFSPGIHLFPFHFVFSIILIWKNK